MDSLYTDVVNRLVESFPRLTPELQKAARFMVENPAEVGLNSMRAVASSAGVRPATMSRLTRALGYDRYATLRQPFRDRLRKPAPEFRERMLDMQQLAKAGDRDLYAALRAKDIENIERSLSDENYAEMEAAAALLHDSERVYVLGLRGAYAPAFLFHYEYQLFRDNSQLLDTRAGIFADQLRGIGPSDCLIAVSFPPYTLLTIDAVEYAAEAGANIVAVTDSRVSPAARVAAHTIVTQMSSPSFYHSFTAALAVMQALIALLVARVGGDAVKIVEEAERQLARISAYW